MKSHFTWSPRIGAGLLALSFGYVAGGCSLVYNLSTSQCEVDDDCLALGADFEDTVCRSNLCVDASSGGSGGSETEGGRGGKDSGGSSGSGGSNAGGADAEGGMGGEAGTPTDPPECATNKDCIEAHVDVPYICRQGACLKLTTDECPLLLPTAGNVDLLKSGTPIILGGFANLTNPQDPRDTPSAINWDLVYQEFNDSTLGGIPSSSGTQPLIGLICNGAYPASDSTTLPRAINHLVSAVGVPGMLTTLSSDRLKTAWDLTQDIVKGTERPVLFVSSVAADLALANLSDDGLMWHFLGDPRTTASTLASLVKRIEPTIKSARSPSDTGPLRVTLIYSSNSTNVDLRTVLTTSDADHPDATLSFNGKAATDPENSVSFRTVAIPAFSSSTATDVSAAVADLKGHPPNLIIGLGGREFPTIMTQIEREWGASDDAPATVGLARPYWLLSYLIWHAPELAAAVPLHANKTPPLALRTLGVNYAEAQDAKSKQLYNEYSSRLSNFYKGQLSVGGTENYYDSAYALLYAVAGANRVDPDGDALLGGLGHVLSKGSVSVDIGPSKISTTVSNLVGSKTYKMALYGTMGPPDFDSVSGTRNNTPTSVWCIENDGTWQGDGLIYDSGTATFTNGSSVPNCLKDY